MVPPLAGTNHRIRRLRRLGAQRDARREEQAYLLEGPILVAEALGTGVALEAVYAEEGFEAPALETATRAGVPVYLVAAGALAHVTDAVTPRPLLGVAPLVSFEVEDLIASCAARGRPLVVLVDVRDPGNLGTILRAAEAAGAAGAICCKGSVDPWSPKAVRSSAGAILHVPVAAGPGALEALAQLGERGVRRVGTVVEGGAPHDSVDLTKPVAFVMGSEAHGLAPELADLLDVEVTIAMEGRVESLNVAMAATVLCFEALRQRRGVATDWTAPPHGDKVIRP